MASLVPCVDCRRHIRIDHTNCPFCDATVPVDFAKRVIPPARKRLDRLATFSFATTLVVAACGDVDQQAPLPDGGTVTEGGARQDASTDGSVATDAAFDSGFAGDTGTVGTKYGMPPIDSGVDDGGPAVLYGLPPNDAAHD